jgi:hypothetical protein
MPLDAPFTLGPFLVTETGELSPNSPDTVPAFSVRWRERPVHVRMARGEPGSMSGVLALSMVLGRVPSTAGGDTGTRQDARARAFGVVHCLRRALPSDWGIALLPDHRVALKTETGLPSPPTAAELVTKVTMFLLTLDPYLDFVEETGAVEAASPASGMLNIWPG